MACKHLPACQTGDYDTMLRGPSTVWMWTVLVLKGKEMFCTYTFTWN
jgi:hypothetical protein